MMAEQNRVAIYCRLSKEDLDKDLESESIKNQKNMLTQYAKEQCWDIYDYYIDEDYSGSDRMRPDFNRLISDAVLGRFSIVLCKKQSRFARDIEFVERYIHGLFYERQIRFIALLDHIDTGLHDKSFKKTSRISSLMDEWYLEDLSENTSSALTWKRKNGEFIGTWAPYGYMKHPDNKNRLTIDPYAASVVKRIFKLYNKGYGITRIAQLLNMEGKPNPTEYRRQMNIMKCHKSANQSIRNTYWTPATISGILKNETYLGHMVQGKLKKVSYKSNKLIRVPKDQWIIVKNCHDPIIDKQLWERVQIQLNSRTRAHSKRQRHLLAGKVFCGECGKRLVSSGGRSGYSKTTYLCCSTRLINKKACIGSRIQLPILISLIQKRIRELMDQYYDEEYLIKNTEHKKIECTEQQLQLHILGNEIGIKGNDYKPPPLKREIIREYCSFKSLSRDAVNILIDKIYVEHKDEDGKQVIRILWNI
jgi:site-specific DNA recombinase